MQKEEREVKEGLLPGSLPSRIVLSSGSFLERCGASPWTDRCRLLDLPCHYAKKEKGSDHRSPLHSRAHTYFPCQARTGPFFSPVHIASQSHRTVDLVVCGRNLVKHLPDLMARGFVDLFGHSCARKDFYELALTLSKILPYEQYIL